MTITTTTFPIHRTVNDRKFRIELATNSVQKQAVYAMRYQIFNVELEQGLQSSTATALDHDKYDEYCDHLLVIDEDNEKIVGTYRVLPYQRVKNNIGLYSQTEFQLNNIYAADLPLVEVGRACIDKSYRDGSVISLLWSGLGRYMQENQLRYMCGCASLNKGDTGHCASLIYQYCQSNNKLIDEHLRVMANAKNKVDDFNSNISLDKSQNIKRNMSLLLRGYLSLGCKIGGEPAYDPEFGVIDFFIWLDLKTMPKSSQRFLA